MRHTRAAFRVANTGEELFCKMEVHDKKKRKSGMRNSNVMTYPTFPHKCYT
jgi:hypothetical protein